MVKHKLYYLPLLISSGILKFKLKYCDHEKKKYMYFFSLQLLVASILSHEAVIVGIINKWARAYPKVAQTRGG